MNNDYVPCKEAAWPNNYHGRDIGVYLATQRVKGIVADCRDSCIFFLNKKFGVLGGGGCSLYMYTDKLSKSVTENMLTSLVLAMCE